MTFSLISQFNSPGKGAGTGDDRFGHDAGAGTAWVVDGATDLGPVRLFREQESDAAWLAEALSALLMTHAHNDRPSTEYLSGVLAALADRARKASRMPMDKAPPESLPIASGMWMRAGATEIDFAWLGDCMALVRSTDGRTTPIGTEEKADRETETSRRMASASSEEKLAELRRIRAIQNTTPEHALFGLSPHAAQNICVRTLRRGSVTDVVLMTDGLWRLVQPYGAMTADELMALIVADGLDAALRHLRAHEAAPRRDLTTRFKAADDACAIHLRP